MKYAIESNTMYGKFTLVRLEPSENEVEVLLEIIRAAFYYASNKKEQFITGVLCTRKNLMKCVEMENLEKPLGYVVNTDYIPHMLFSRKVVLQIQRTTDPHTFRINAHMYENTTSKSIEDVLEKSIEMMEMKVGFTE